MSETTVDKAPATEAPTALSEAMNLAEAQEAILGMLDADEAQPETEDAPTEETEDSQPEEDEDVSEDEADVEVDEDEDDYEGTDNREEEGEDVEETYSVKVDGGDVDVTLDELLSGYSRQSDYTKKTQEIATERKSIEEFKQQFGGQMEQLNQQRQQYHQALGQLGQHLTSGLNKYAGVDWARLKADDPIEYVTKRDEFREENEKIQAIATQQRRVQQEQHQEAERVRGQFISTEIAKLGEIIPEWNDPEKQPIIAKEIRNYGSASGYSDEELDGLVDSRSVHVLLKAMRYDALQNADLKKKKVKNKPKLARPGTKRAKADAAKRRKADSTKQLKKSGSVKDAARLLEDLL